MRVSKWILTTVLLGLSAVVTWAQAGASPEKPAAGGTTNAAPDESARPTSLTELTDRIFKREHDQVALFSLYRPIVETYIQELKKDREMGFVPSRDYYYLGQADLSHGLVDYSMLPRKGFWFTPELSVDYSPEFFIQATYVDRYRFDKQHYDLKYVGKAFLGDVRCFVFDAKPLPKAGREVFTGRIWVEDQNYTIVRFNGVYLPQRSFLAVNAHFDSWRLNVQPDLWLPAFVFTQELNPKSFGANRFRGQTRFWGYSLNSVRHEEAFSDIFVDPSTNVQDDSAGRRDRAPIEAEREWQREAEENTMDSLVRDGLIAPEGPVDKILDTVLNNLIVTNNLNIDPEPHCRVLLTSNIEAFSLNHTIVVSRGLLDVLPDEATLATVLAEELSDALVPKLGEDQYGFGDTAQVPTAKALKHFSFKDSREEWEATGEKAIALLRNSPYRDKLGTAGLFLKQLSADSKVLPHLIGANLGNQIYPVAELLNSGQPLRPDEIKQIAALPLGARIKLDPWTDDVQLLQSKPAVLASAREKMPLEITPFMPYLTRYHKENGAADAPDVASGSGGAK